MQDQKRWCRWRYPLLGLGFGFVVALPLHAKDSSGFHATYGPGTMSCSDFRAARETGGVVLDLYQNFVFGYLSAFNLINPKTFDILGTRTMGEAMKWLDEYCGQQSGENMTNALAALTVHYFEGRSQAKVVEAAPAAVESNVADPNR